MSALGGEADIPRSRSGSVNDPRVDLEENWHGDSNSTFPAKNYGLPAPRIREKPIQATEMQGVFCWDVKALSLQLGQITLQFPKLQGETGWLQTASTATSSRVFRLSPDTRGDDPKNPWSSAPRALGHSKSPRAR